MDETDEIDQIDEIDQKDHIDHPGGFERTWSVINGNEGD